MNSLYAAFAGNPTINYLKTFVDSQGNPHQLILDSLGVVRDDFPEATFTTIGTVVAAAFAQSDTYAGREWLAIGDGKYGIDIPRQYDGTNFDRVSQVGPGIAPTAQDVQTTTLNIAASPGGLIPQTRSANAGSMTESGNIVTVTTSVNLDAGVRVGDEVVITGALPAGYNGTFKIAALTGSNQFQYSNNTTGLAASTQAATINFNTTLVTLTANAPAGWGPVNSLLTIAGAGVAGYNGSWQVRVATGGGTTLYLYVTGADAPLAASGAGTIVDSGNISAGVHQVSVSFVTRQNYITCPAPPFSWTAAGSKKVSLGAIPVGPSNIIARIVMFTPVITAPATTGPFFYFSRSVATPTAGTFPSMYIGDNVTTIGTFDFIDSILQSATAATNLFNLIELGECSAVLSYSERLFWAGERNKVNAAGGGGGLNNLTFDGGFATDALVRLYPLGWTENSVFYPGGGDILTNNPALGVVWGNAYTISGNGATATRGQMSQTAYQDYLGVPIINPATAYSVRVRLKAKNANQAGTVHIRLNSPSQGAAGVGLAVLANTIPTANYQEFTAALVTASVYPSPNAIPSDLVLEVYEDGTPNQTDVVALDNIELYPTNNPINRTIIRTSYALQPEAFDSVTGFMVVGKDNGQAAKCFGNLLDGKLYIAKERSFYATQDDGANEPSLWSITQISGTVGTPSVHGIDRGESWLIVAGHDGPYLFWGAEMVKVGQEIQPDWDTVNWAAGQNLYTVVDTTNRRIHIGLPTGTSTVPNQEFVMDFSQLGDGSDIASAPQAHYAYFNPSNIVAPGRARKWTIWNFFAGVGANSAALTIRADGSYHLLRGNAAANGKVYDQVATQTSDDGTAINPIYQTYYFPSILETMELQLGSHRKLTKYLTGSAFGSGALSWSIHGAQDNRVKALSTLTLTNPAKWDFELNINFPAERASLILSQNAVGSWFHLSKLCPTVQRDIPTPVRGVA
jgi:hypothetical protein